MNPIYRLRKLITQTNHIISRRITPLRTSNSLRRFILSQSGMFCIIIILFTACDSSAITSSTNSAKQTLSISSGSTITYSTRSQDVLIRTFYGGGKLGTFEMSPEISIYGDGTFILGPGLQMQQGRIHAAALQQLLNKMADTYGLLKLNKQQFYDIPDQNATVLQLMLNDKEYTYLYGPFGNMQESVQDLNEYRHLGNALTSITRGVSWTNAPLHQSTDGSTCSSNIFP